MADCKADHIGFDLFKRAQIAIISVEHHAHAFMHVRAFGPILLAKQLAQLGEALSGQRVGVAIDRSAEQHRLQLAHIARPVIGSKQGERGFTDRQVVEARLLTDASAPRLRVLASKLLRDVTRVDYGVVTPGTPDGVAKVVGSYTGR